MNTIQPATAVSTATPTATAVRLHSFGGIFLGAFLGNLLAMGLLMSQNYKQLGEHDKARSTLIYASLAMLVIFALVLVLPEQVPVIAFNAPQIAVAYLFAKNHHMEHVIPHLAKGGTLHSRWRGAGIGLLVGVLTLAATLPVLLMFV